MNTKEEILSFLAREKYLKSYAKKQILQDAIYV